MGDNTLYCVNQNIHSLTGDHESPYEYVALPAYIIKLRHSHERLALITGIPMPEKTVSLLRRGLGFKGSCSPQDLLNAHFATLGVQMFQKLWIWCLVRWIAPPRTHESHGVSKHRHFKGLFSNLFMLSLITSKVSKLRFTGPLWDESTLTMSCCLMGDNTLYCVHQSWPSSLSHVCVSVCY